MLVLVLVLVATAPVLTMLVAAPVLVVLVVAAPVLAMLVVAALVLVVLVATAPVLAVLVALVPAVTAFQLFSFLLGLGHERSMISMNQIHMNYHVTFGLFFLLALRTLDLLTSSSLFFLEDGGLAKFQFFKFPPT